jgi:hypothetical protein
MDRKVTFPPERAPRWPDLAAGSAARGVPVQVRMIDDQLALPDEEPGEAWREVRVGTPAGMVTLRREPDGIRLVIWGNADQPLREAWDTLTQAVAQVSGGRVETAE